MFIIRNELQMESFNRSGLRHRLNVIKYTCVCLNMTCMSLPCIQTFEAKLLNIESRPGRKSKNSGYDDLEIFMRCEVHSSDTDIFINSLKRVADDVRTIPEEKGYNTIRMNNNHTFLIIVTFFLSLRIQSHLII